MADVRIQDLPTITTIDDNDYLIIDQYDGVSTHTASKATASSFKANLVPVVYVWNSEVPVTSGVHTRWYTDRAGTISWCEGQVVNGDGLFDAEFDVRLNGSTIYPSSTKPTVPAGEFIGIDRVPDTTSFSKGDYFQVMVLSTGSTSGRLRLLISFY